MSNSVVAAAAASRAKHLVPSKKITKRPEDQRSAQDERQDADHEPKTAKVVQTADGHQHTSGAENSMSGEFSFASALAGAASDNSSLSFAQDGDSGSSDDGSGGGGTLLAIGAVGLVGAGVAVLAGGGGGNKNADPVFGAAQTITVLEDSGAQAITVTATDADNDALTYTNTAPTKGTLTGTAGSYVYTPNANANGSDSFTVTAKDPSGGTVTQTVTINITAVNDAPTVAATQAITTDEGVAATLTVAGADVDGDALTYTVPATGAGAPARGVVTVGANGALTYTPNANESGPDTFIVTVSDGKGGTVTQTVSVTIVSDNAPPLAGAENTNSLTLAEDTTAAFVIDYTDPDGANPDALTVALTVNPQHGTINGTTNVYTPTANFNGTDSFTYTVTDADGGVTTKTVNITVTPVNDAPVAAAEQDVVTAAGAAATITVAATDVDGDTLTYDFAANDSANGASNGTVTAGATLGTFIYTPDAGFEGIDDFTVTISDGTASITQVVSVAVGDVGPAVGDLDVGTTTTKITIDAGADSFSFEDDIDVTSNVLLTNFTADDVIELSGAANLDVYSYGTGVGAGGADDLIITFNDGTRFAEITIENLFQGATPLELLGVNSSAAAIDLAGYNFITLA